MAISEYNESEQIQENVDALEGTLKDTIAIKSEGGPTDKEKKLLNEIDGLLTANRAAISEIVQEENDNLASLSMIGNTNYDKLVKNKLFKRALTL